MNVCIAVAHQLELAPFLSRFPRYETLQTGHGKLFRLEWDDLILHVIRTGIGLDNARNSLLAVMESGRQSGAGQVPDLLLNFGTCGAIHPERKVGDLVVGTRTTRDYHLNTLRKLDAGWGERFAGYLRKAKIRYVTGTIYSTDRAVASRQVRREIYQRTNAQVVDMESSSLAEVADTESLPFLSVKYVSDNADEFVMKDFLANIEDATAELSRIIYGFVESLGQEAKHPAP